MYADIPNTLPGGSTNMVEGLYRGWDELRSVPAGQQSGLRVIVLFTDGASNSVPGNYDAAPGQGRTLRTYDFPKVLPDPDNQTHDAPTIAGLYATNTANSPSGPNINGANGSANVVPSNWDNQCLTAADFNDVNCPSNAKYLPLASYHAHHRSSGIPDSFPLHVDLAHGQRHGPVHGPSAAQQERDDQPLSDRGLEHQQRRPQPGRDHRGRRARGHAATIRSGST